MSDKLKKLEIKEGQIKARIVNKKGRQDNSERKKDTRRKILVGALFLDHYRNKGEMERLIKHLDAYLTRDQDRKLFNLPPKTHQINNDASGA